MLFVQIKTIFFFFLLHTITNSTKYNSTSKQVTDNDLCNVTFPGWGETWSIENLDTSSYERTEYFANLINYLKFDKYFISNFTIRGAPYDFRKTSETYVNGDKRRVVVLSHSMGGLFTLLFFNKQTLEWKKKYIESYISIATPLGGAPDSFKVIASGTSQLEHLINSIDYRPLQRSMPSIAFLLPDPRIWAKHEPIIITPTVNYSAHDYKTFFNDIGFDIGYEMMLDTKQTFDQIHAPEGIDNLYCIHGITIPTPVQFIYHPPSIFIGQFPNQDPTIVYGNGDGTVPLRSLQLCATWKNVNYVIYPGVNHVSVINDKRFLKLLKFLTKAMP